MNVDKVHKTRPNNRESCTVIKHVNGDGASIPPRVIFNSIEIQGTWAENNVRNSVVFTTAGLSYTNDWTGYEWIPLFDRASKRY